MRKKRPRSKKLLRLIRNNSLEDDEFKIIISGKSAFKIEVDELECERLRDYLISYGVNENSIVLEKESMDTLGNMIFSMLKIQLLLEENNTSSSPNINITLITEHFHMKRSKQLFSQIFNFLYQVYPNISIYFVSAQSFGFSKLFLKKN